jgi:hypothetical protein
VWSNRAVEYGLRSTNSGSASIYIERQKCGSLLTASDLSVGAQLTSGSYSGYYVREVITAAGAFWGVEGGNRPTFISGGKQEDRIRDIQGHINYGLNQSTVSGAFKFESGPGFGVNPDGATNFSNFISFSASNSVGPDHVGTDDAPANISIRLWRRVS